MRVCLIGYGKMGKAIEEILLQRSHEITGQIGNSNRDELIDSLKKSEVAIEFTHPEAAVHNLKLCFEYQVPVVCGTTGWLNHWNEIIDELKQKNGSLLFASNFSIGVQIFFALNKNLAAMMSAQMQH
jgi:4-hydroxy-tetrahydrodipicolinate reductase